MPKIKHGDKEVEVSKNKSLRKDLEKLGVPFNCENGVCGTCYIEILDGEENLSEVNQKEKNLGMDRKNRLGCQCQMKKDGAVEVDF